MITGFLGGGVDGDNGLNTTEEDVSEDFFNKFPKDSDFITNPLKSK